MSRWKKKLSKKNVARVLAASLTVAPLVYALPPVVAQVGKAYAEDAKFSDQIFYYVVDNNPDNDSKLDIDLNEFFDGSSLILESSSVTSFNTAVVSVSHSSENTWQLQAVGLGTTTITLTAMYESGPETHSFDVTVNENHAPTAHVIPERFIEIGETTVYDLPAFFSDNDNDPLTYEVSTWESIGAIANIDQQTHKLTITGTDYDYLYSGQISVTATDSKGASITETIRLQVKDTEYYFGGDDILLSLDGGTVYVVPDDVFAEIPTKAQLTQLESSSLVAVSEYYEGPEGYYDSIIRTEGLLPNKRYQNYYISSDDPGSKARLESFGYLINKTGNRGNISDIVKFYFSNHINDRQRAYPDTLEKLLKLIGPINEIYYGEGEGPGGL